MDARERWDEREHDEWADRFLRKVEAMGADEQRVLAIKIRTDAESIAPGVHRVMVEFIARAIERMAQAKGQG